MKARIGLAALTASLIFAASGVASAKIYLIGGESPSEGNGASPNNQPVGRGGNGPTYGNVGQAGRDEMRRRRTLPPAGSNQAYPQQY